MYFKYPSKNVIHFKTHETLQKFRKEMNEDTEVDVSDDESESDAQSIHEEIINTWSRKTSSKQ